MNRWFSEEPQMSRPILKMQLTVLAIIDIKIKTTLGVYLRVVRMAATKRENDKAGEMTQWLRTLAAPPDSLCLIPNAHVAAQSHM